MVKLPSSDLLRALENEAKAAPAIDVESGTLLSLIAAARELEQMRQQVCVLVREDMLELPAGYGGVHDPEFSDAAAIAGFRALAEESGWGPTNGR